LLSGTGFHSDSKIHLVELFVADYSALTKGVSASKEAPLFAWIKSGEQRKDFSRLFGSTLCSLRLSEDSFDGDSEI